MSNKRARIALGQTSTKLSLGLKPLSAKAGGVESIKAKVTVENGGFAISKAEEGGRVKKFLSAEYRYHEPYITKDNANRVLGLNPEYYPDAVDQFKRIHPVWRRHTFIVQPLRASDTDYLCPDYVDERTSACSTAPYVKGDEKFEFKMIDYHPTNTVKF